MVPHPSDVRAFPERRIAVVGGWIYQAKGGMPHKGRKPRPYFKESNAEAVLAFEFKGRGMVVPLDGGYGIFVSANAFPDDGQARSCPVEKANLA